MRIKINTPEEAARYLFFFLLQKKGGLEFIDKYILFLKDKNTFTDPKYYSRLRKKLKRYLEGDILKKQYSRKTTGTPV